MKLTLTSNEMMTTQMYAVCATYLMTKTFAECQRNQVSKVHAEILTECPIYPEQKSITRGAANIPLTENNLYLADLNSPEINDYYAECDHRLRKLGIKPVDMETEHCPALTAESIQRNAEWDIVDLVCEKLDIESNAFRYKLKEKDQLIELTMRLVINAPGFKKFTLKRINAN